MSHIAYYGPSKRLTGGRQPARRVKCQAFSSGGNGKSGRRARVKQQAAQIAESLDRLQLDGNLASYDLKLPAAYESTYLSNSSSSSSSSESSDDDFNEPTTFRRTPTIAPTVATVAVCTGKACKKRGADNVYSAIKSSATPGLEVTTCKCQGQCKRGPAVAVTMPDGQEILYVGVHDATALTSTVRF